MCVQRNGKPNARGCEHHALNSDIYDTASLAENSGKSPQANRCREAEALGSKADHIHSPSHTCPHQYDHKDSNTI